MYTKHLGQCSINVPLGTPDYTVVARLVEGNWLYLRMNHSDLAWSIGQYSGFLCLSQCQSFGAIAGEIFSASHLEIFWFFTCFQRWLIPGGIIQMQIINLHDGPAHVGKTQSFLAVNMTEPTKKRKALEQYWSTVASLDVITPWTNTRPLHRWRFRFEGHWTLPISLMHHN